jgi:hypothetical protein
MNDLINTKMYNSPGFLTTHIFIIIGIEIKLSLALSHQLTPDVYEGVLFNKKNSYLSIYVTPPVIQGDSMSTHSHIMLRIMKYPIY